MKKRIGLWSLVLLLCLLLAGCGSSGSQTETSEETQSTQSAQAASDDSESSLDEEEADAEEGSDAEDEADLEEGSEADAESDTEDAADAEDEADADETEETSEAPLPDGVYSAEFQTHHSMFHVNEANDGRGILTVEDGQMVIHVSLVSKNIVNLFMGKKEDAQKEGAELLEPTVDTVTYSDGYTEEVYGFDVPVPYLDKEFDVALIGTKGKWYDHQVIVSDPEPIE